MLNKYALGIKFFSFKIITKFNPLFYVRKDTLSIHNFDIRVDFCESSPSECYGSYCIIQLYVF